MTKKERALLAIELLKQVYPDAICSLDYEKPHELLISTRLAAQCTDARVNIVTKDLYQKYQSLEDFASADLAELEEMCAPADSITPRPRISSPCPRCCWTSMTAFCLTLWKS